jgi:hypothetical protein
MRMRIAKCEMRIYFYKKFLQKTAENTAPKKGSYFGRKYSPKKRAVILAENTAPQKRAVILAENTAPKKGQ